MFSSLEATVQGHRIPMVGITSLYPGYWNRLCLNRISISTQDQALPSCRWSRFISSITLVRLPCPHCKA